MSSPHKNNTVSLDTRQSWASWRLLTGHTRPAEDWTLQKFLCGGDFSNESLSKDGNTRTKLQKYMHNTVSKNLHILRLPVVSEQWLEAGSFSQYCHQPPFWQCMQTKQALGMYFSMQQPRRKPYFQVKNRICGISNALFSLQGRTHLKRNETQNTVWSNLEGGVKENL